MVFLPDVNRFVWAALLVGCGGEIASPDGGSSKCAPIVLTQTADAGACQTVAAWTCNAGFDTYMVTCSCSGGGQLSPMCSCLQTQNGEKSLLVLSESACLCGASGAQLANACAYPH